MFLLLLLLVLSRSEEDFLVAGDDFVVLESDSFEDVGLSF